MNDAEAVLQRYVKAFEERDLDALVSCWHRDAETTHVLRPDRSWQGTDLYRKVMSRIWERTPDEQHEVVSTSVNGDFAYVESVTRHEDGTVMPAVMVFEIEGDRIRRARVYTEKQVHDGVTMEELVFGLNP
jgi:hypothetical protein